MVRRKGITRRKVMTGAAGIGAATILHWPASAAEFSYKYGSVLPITHPMVAGMAEVAPLIKEATGGQFEYAVYPSSALGSDTAMMAQAISGALQMYSLSSDILGTRNPAVGITGVGFAWNGYGQNWAASDGEVGAWYRGAAEKLGLAVMPKAFDHGFRHITMKGKPINTPDDLRGVKIRLPVAPAFVALFKALGAAPLAMNLGEVYSALQTGIADGQENPLQLIDESKFYEVQKYVSLTGHIWSGLHTSFNLAAWQKLGPKIQDIAGHYFEEAALKERKVWLDNLAVVTKSLQDHGMVFNTPDIEPFRALARKNGFYEEMKKRMGDEAWALLEKYAGKLV